MKEQDLIDLGFERTDVSAEEIIKDVFEWLSKMDYLSDDMDILLEEYKNQNKDEIQKETSSH